MFDIVLQFSRYVEQAGNRFANKLLWCMALASTRHHKWQTLRLPFVYLACNLPCQTVRGCAGRALGGLKVPRMLCETARGLGVPTRCPEWTHAGNFGAVLATIDREWPPHTISSTSFLERN